MAKEIDPSKAKDWSDEEYEFNVKYLQDRGRQAELDAVYKARGVDGPPASATPSDTPNTGPEPGAPKNTDTVPDSGGPQVPDHDAAWVQKTKVQAVLDWVGEDASRAEFAYTAEKASDDPRSTLLEGLEANFDFEE